MTTGLKIPVSVSKTGGFALSTGEEDAYKMISSALSDNENNHAFQQNLGLDPTLVFSTNNATTRAEILHNIRTIFGTFTRAKLFSLVESSIVFKKENSGEVTIEFNYVNLETDELKTFKKTFSSTEG